MDPEGVLPVLARLTQCTTKAQLIAALKRELNALEPAMAVPVGAVSTEVVKPHPPGGAPLVAAALPTPIASAVPPSLAALTAAADSKSAALVAAAAASNKPAAESSAGASAASAGSAAAKPAAADGLCHGMCGFHGNPKTNGYCSKCWKQLNGFADAMPDVKSGSSANDASTAAVLVADEPLADSKDSKDMKSGGGTAASKRRKAQHAVMMSKVAVGAKLNELMNSFGTGASLTPMKLYNKLKAENWYFTVSQARQLRRKIGSLPAALAVGGGSGMDPNLPSPATAYEHVLCSRVVDRENLAANGVEGQYECDHYPADYIVADGVFY